MVRFLSWIIGLVLAAAIVAFAVANRTPVVLDLWPLPYTVEVGCYLAVLGAAAAGLIVGFVLGRLGRRGRKAAVPVAAAPLPKASDPPALPQPH